MPRKDPVRRVGRTLKKPLKSTVKELKELFKDVRDLPEAVILDMALSHDQYISDWKAGMLDHIERLDKAKSKNRKATLSAPKERTSRKRI